MIKIQDLWRFAVPTVCRSVPHDEIHRIRKNFKGREFKQAVLFGCLKLACEEWRVHHIIPISLGGTNKRDNLAVVEPQLEIMIHKFIDQQSQPYGDREMVLYIPRMIGRVWFPQQLSM